VTTARPFWPPATRNVSPFQNNIPLFSYPYYALPPDIQSHLPNASSLNTCKLYLPCGKFLHVLRSERKNYSNATSIYILYNTH